MLFGVRWSLFVVRRSISVVCNVLRCLLFVACALLVVRFFFCLFSCLRYALCVCCLRVCLLFVACYVLFVMSYSVRFRCGLSVVCCLQCSVCGSLFGVGCLVFVGCCALCAVR